MNANTSMRCLLKKHLNKSIHNIPQDNAYPIWEKTDIAGRVYWGVSTFWGLDKHPIHSNQDLSLLEWDGNEVCLTAQTDDEITDILMQMIGILTFWKNELEIRYPETPFYLFASYDNGDMMILDKDESPIKSVTLRFWAHRGGSMVINLEHLKWEQPAIIGYCNFVPLKSK